MQDKRPETSRVVIIDSHFIVREGLRAVLAQHQDFDLVGEAADWPTAQRLLEEWQPQIVLLDMHASGINGLLTIQQLCQRWPQTAILLFTNHDDDELLLAGLAAGCIGYVRKDVDRASLLHALCTAARGEILLRPGMMARLLQHQSSQHKPKEHSPPTFHQSANMSILTRREHDVLVGVARGERNKEVAARLGISSATVKTHLASIFYKLNVDSRASAVAVAMERGILLGTTGTNSASNVCYK
jgi:NarL family two-component system response regulator YdfI